DRYGQQSRFLNQLDSFCKDKVHGECYLISLFFERQARLESRPFQQPTSILGVPVRSVGPRQCLKLRCSNEAKLERYLFRTGNLQSLPLLNSLNKGRS